MQFVVFGRPGEAFTSEIPPEDLNEVLQAEWAKSREYYAKGILRHIWMQQGNHSVIAIYEASSREEMEAINAEYPMVKKGYAHHEIHALDPYTGFVPEQAG